MSQFPTEKEIADRNEREKRIRYSTVKEIDMADQELNKWLHENVMGECSHKSDKHPSNPRCSKCFINHFLWIPMPDYCNSLDAVAKVEAKVIEAVGMEPYLNELMKAVGWQFANARQRAEACKEAWEAE